MITFANSFPSRFLKAADLIEAGHRDGIAVTIHSVNRTKVKGNDGKTERKTVVMFHQTIGTGENKPLILNRTNFRKINELVGCGSNADASVAWPGARIELFVTDIMAFGQEQPAIRFREAPPDPSEYKRGADRKEMMAKLIAQFGGDKEAAVNFLLYGVGEPSDPAF